MYNPDDTVSTDLLWIRDLQHIFKYGHRVSPRGQLVYECLGYQSVISMAFPIISNPIRKLGYKFMAAEAAWILSGRNDVASISRYSKDISKFSDNGVSFYGAYGPKIKDQLLYAFDALVRDPDSRQAVVTIWRENPPPSKDIPCTVSLQWLIRHGRLHCVANMRSSDLWLGHPYDIFNFSAVSFSLMLHLNNMRSNDGLEPLQLGELYLTAGSKHIYERNIEAVGAILTEFDKEGPPKFNHKPVFVSERYDSADEFVDHLWGCAELEDGAKALMEH